MLRARYLCCALVIAACANASSRLDKVTTTDPPAADKPKPPDDDKGSGFDLRGMLAKVGEALAKPGYYEAPDKSAGYDAGKPHWGVLALAGGIVEQKSWSFTGGHGTELRALSERLRELAGDKALTGVIL